MFLCEVEEWVDVFDGVLCDVVYCGVIFFDGVEDGGVFVDDELLYVDDENYWVFVYVVGFL